MIYSKTSVLRFGKHRGETIKEIISDDVTYIEWALDEVDGFELDEAAMDLYEKQLEVHYSNEGYWPSPHYSDQ